MTTICDFAKVEKTNVWQIKDAFYKCLRENGHIYITGKPLATSGLQTIVILNIYQTLSVNVQLMSRLLYVCLFYLKD